MIFVVILLVIPIVVALFALAGWILQMLLIGIFTVFGLLSDISFKLAVGVFVGIIALLVVLTVLGVISWGDLFWTIMDTIGEGLGKGIQWFLHRPFH